MGSLRTEDVGQDGAFGFSPCKGQYIAAPPKKYLSCFLLARVGVHLVSPFWGWSLFPSGLSSSAAQYAVGGRAKTVLSPELQSKRIIPALIPLCSLGNNQALLTRCFALHLLQWDHAQQQVLCSGVFAGLVPYNKRCQTGGTSQDLRFCFRTQPHQNRTKSNNTRAMCLTHRAVVP